MMPIPDNDKYDAEVLVFYGIYGLGPVVLLCENESYSDYIPYIQAKRKIISYFDDNFNEICFNCVIEKPLVLLKSWKLRLF